MFKPHENYFNGMWVNEVKDLFRWKRGTKIGLSIHHYIYGKSEGRITNMNFLCELYPDFDVNFYKSIHDDLKNMSDTEAKMHYYIYGKSEGRLINEKQIFNEELQNTSTLYNNYYYHILLQNKKYIECDFVVNYDYTLPELNDKINNLICNHIYFRTIDTYEKLTKHFKQYEKKYYIYNKESFYTYYYDFDYEYYKNKYFKDDISSSEKDILLYYHSKGKYEKHNINNKINIFMYSPPYSNTCGGITKTRPSSCYSC
jgi:hypothetical protein